MSSRWTDAIGGEPTANTYFFRVEDGRVTAMRATAQVDGWEQYLRFVRGAATPEDFAAMFASRPDGMGIIGLPYTDESIELHSQWTEEFESVRGG